MRAIRFPGLVAYPDNVNASQFNFKNYYSLCQLNNDEDISFRNLL